MDSPPNLETVHQAVYSLYNNPAPAETEKASQWLGELQKSVFAWKIADEMLQQKRDLQSCYFAAQTMRTKIQMSFDELPIEAHTSLRDSLLDHISQINEHTHSVIVTQLCLAIADFMLQMSSWQKPVIDLMNRFGSAPSSLWPLLEIMIVLPEEINSRSLRLGSNRRQQVLVELSTISDTVIEFLKMCLKNGGENPEIHARILRCFTSWITVHAIPLNAVPNNEIVAYVFQVLSNHTITAQVHRAATDCVCSILQVLERDSNSNLTQNHNETNTQMEQLQLCLFTSVMALEQPYHMTVALEDLDKSLSYCRIFTELAETFLNTMVNGSVGGKQHYAIKSLDLVLTCVGHHLYEVAQVTFNLWFRLSEVIYAKNCKDLQTIFEPYIERLIGSLCKHCQMEPDHLGLVEEVGGGEEFVDFRDRVSELIHEVVFVVGSKNCFRQMFNTLTGEPGPQGQPAQIPTWESSEAALFVMQSVAKNIMPNDNEIVPKVVEAILNMPENTHIAVRHTSILLLGELSDWIENHPQSLEPVLNFLLTSLSQKGLANAASGALQNICSVSLCMGPHIQGLLQIARSFDSFPINNEAAIRLLKGIAAILSRLPADERAKPMSELCWFQATRLTALLEHGSRYFERGTQSDPIVWLDRLAVIFRHSQFHARTPSEQHPYQVLCSELWHHVLSKTLDVYQEDPRIMERTCRCLRFMFRCATVNAMHIIEPLIEKMVQLYATNYHSCFLYLGSVLVDENGTEVECQAGLIKMLEAFIPPAFSILQQENGLRNHPDTVDDLFRLCARFLQKAPIVCLNSPAFSSIVDCALMASSLDHRDANSSVMKFFFDLIYCGLSHNSRPDFKTRQQLVQPIIKEKGQILVTRLLHASVFSLSSFMFGEVADVIVGLASLDRSLLSTWLEEAIKSMPTQNAGGSPTATPEQLLEFHNTVTRAVSPKVVTHALRNFARLYR